MAFWHVTKFKGLVSLSIFDAGGNASIGLDPEARDNLVKELQGIKLPPPTKHIAFEIPPEAKPSPTTGAVDDLSDILG